MVNVEVVHKEVIVQVGKLQHDLGKWLVKVTWSRAGFRSEQWRSMTSNTRAY